jgi:hypothetical protein
VGVEDVRHRLEAVKISQTLNLDVSTLLALTSDLCYSVPARSCPIVQQVPALRQQAAEEGEAPLVPQFIQLFNAANRVIVSQSAYDGFFGIIKYLGGGDESDRAQMMFQQGLHKILPLTQELCLEVVPDEMSPRFAALSFVIPSVDKLDLKSLECQSVLDRLESHLPHLGRLIQQSTPRPAIQKLVSKIRLSMPKLNERHLAIFGTGDHHQATTLTANQWVKKSLEHMDHSGQFALKYGDLSVWLHPSRSLIERRHKGLGRGRDKFMM